MYWVYFVSASLISLVMASVPFFIAKNSNFERDKSAGFECGFSAASETLLPFSLRFFVIAIIFVIFDVEIALILPVLLDFSEAPSVSLIFFILLGILWLGTIFEWSGSSLEWKN